MNASALPAQFKERLQIIAPDGQYATILKSFEDKKPLSIRVNTLRISSEVFQQQLSFLSLRKIPWYADAFIVDGVTSRALTELQEYKDGFFYIQNLSSMIPALVLDPQPDEKILDIAAAPGSKTTQIAALMHNIGEILANDISVTRIYKLKQNLEQQGVSISQVNNFPGERIWQKYPEYFDRVLVDAPCSMEGRFYLHDPKSFDHWSLKKVKALAKQQKWLLRSAVSATKPEGVIVYSTCTLAPEENEEVVDWILTKEKGAIEIESIHIPHLTAAAGIEDYKHKHFSSEISKALRIWPDAVMEGFFVAKLRKVRSTCTLS